VSEARLICKNCEAGFPDSEPACPLCGTQPQREPERCCEPVKTNTPSGRWVTHSASCSLWPNGKIRMLRALPRERVLLERRWRTETLRAGIRTLTKRADPVFVHPPCKASAQDGGSVCSRCAPYLHDPGCECEPCIYFEANVDRDDDTGGRLA
jgi:predicted amidophosphoribosyltransferase